MGSHDEVGPFLHGPGGADLPVGDVGGDEAQATLQEDLRAVVHVVLLTGQLSQVILEGGREVGQGGGTWKDGGKRTGNGWWCGRERVRLFD